MMDSSIWLLSVGSVVSDAAMKSGLTIGILVGAVVWSVPAAIGVLLARTAETPRFALNLQTPFLAIGFLSGIVGLALLLAGVAPPVSLGLAAGGGTAVAESVAGMFATVVVWRRRQTPNVRE